MQEMTLNFYSLPILKDGKMDLVTFSRGFIQRFKDFDEMQDKIDMILNTEMIFPWDKPNA
jgi:hypothetical protein